MKIADVVSSNIVFGCALQTSHPICMCVHWYGCVCQSTVCLQAVVDAIAIPLSPAASELVEWFVASGEADDRSQATELGQLLVDTDYIHHVVDEHRLEDAYLFFRFRQDGESPPPPPPSPPAPLV